jgi:hypothetical protein
MQGFVAPGTPAELNKVGILQIGDPKAKSILVLNPGTSASAAYFAPLAKTIVERLPKWQVWAVERRENLLEDHSVLDQAKDGLVSGQALFDYYLGWLANSGDHHALPAHPRRRRRRSAHEWGMSVEIEDLAVVVNEARRHNRRVVARRPLARRLDHHGVRHVGLPRTARREEAQGTRLHRRRQRPDADQPRAGVDQLGGAPTSTPWLTFGGIPSPFAGLFNATGSLGVFLDPDAPSIGQQFPLLPANLKPPIPVTNLAQYGYALDTDTSPPSLIAAQAHMGSSPRAAIRAAGTRPARSRRSSATPRCSRARA